MTWIHIPALQQPWGLESNLTSLCISFFISIMKIIIVLIIDKQYWQQQLYYSSYNIGFSLFLLRKLIQDTYSTVWYLDSALQMFVLTIDSLSLKKFQFLPSQLQEILKCADCCFLKYEKGDNYYQHFVRIKLVLYIEFLVYILADSKHTKNGN